MVGAAGIANLGVQNQSLAIQDFVYILQYSYIGDIGQQVEDNRVHVIDNSVDRRSIYLENGEIIIQDIEDTVALRRLRRITTNKAVDNVLTKWKNQFSANTYSQMEA